MAKEIVHSDEAPAAVGPYSQATVSGDHVFCSGQIALDPRSGELIEGSIADQTRRCMNNIKAVLAAAGTDLSRVVKTTIYLTNLDDFVQVNETYEEFFASDPPARATVGVAALPKGARVEIECIAAK